MTLILLAISLSVTLCVLAFNFAIYALPVMAGISAFQFVHAAGAGFGPSALAALGGAAFSVGLVIAILGFARNPFLRLVALGCSRHRRRLPVMRLLMGSRKTLSSPRLRSTFSAALAG